MLTTVFFFPSLPSFLFHSYFCREYIEGYFLNDPIHSKLINKEVLAKYWDVGGVRIEDDILVTKDGYENLTNAPKGKEMWDIINHGARCKVGDA